MFAKLLILASLTDPIQPVTPSRPLVFGEFNGTDTFKGSKFFLGCIELPWSESHDCTLGRRHLGEAEPAGSFGVVKINAQTGRVQSIKFKYIRAREILGDLVARYGQPKARSTYLVWDGFDNEAVIYLMRTQAGDNLEFYYPQNDPPPKPKEKADF